MWIAPSFLISVRFLIALISFLGYAVQYIQRINMSVAIVCMVNNTGLALRRAGEKIPSESDVQVTESSLNESFITVEDSCYFKEQASGVKQDGPFLWEKGK